MSLYKCFSDSDVELYEKLGYWEKLSLGEELERAVLRYGNKVALIEKNRRLSYAQLNDEANKLAHSFLGLGLQNGDNVAIQLTNSICFVVTCFALFKIGVVPVLTMPAHREKELNGIFAIAQPKAYIFSKSYLGFEYSAMAERIQKNNPCITHLIIDDPDKDFYQSNNLSIEENLELSPPAHENMALLLLSGGTTGIPKLIPRTHADYAYKAKASAIRCGMDAGSVFLAALPVGHNFPLASPGILGTLFTGGTVVLSSTASPDETFPLIAREKVTITALVPSLVNLWLQALEWDDTDISSLEVLLVGGSPLDANLAKRIRPEMNCTLQQVFGTAEGFLSYTSLDDPEEIVLTTQGKPLSPHDNVRIVDENLNDVNDGEVGEMILKGPYSIRGYYKAPEQNKKDFTKDNFYRTGDLAYFTKDGNLIVIGRIKEQINRAGEKIAAAEIESYLNGYPEIETSVLIALPDEELGERSCAVIISSKEVELRELHDFLRNLGVAQYKFPDQLERVDTFPLTSVGKIDKKSLVNMFSDK